MNTKDWLLCTAMACLVVLTGILSAYLLCKTANINTRTEIAEYELMFMKSDWTAHTNYTEVGE